MTASLPMSHDVDPDEPDERQASAQVVSLPTAGEERAPRALHSKRTPKGRRGTAAPGEAVSAVAIPPPPPVPADLAAAGIVVPPKPPLPARSAQEAAQDGARAELVEPADVLAPPEAPEPENTIRTEAPAEAEAATESPVPAVPVEAALSAEPAPPIDHETMDAAPAMFGDAVAAGVAASATAPAVAPAATTSAPEVAPVAPALPAEATAVLVAAAAVKPAPVHEPQLLEEVPDVLNPPVARGEALVIRGVTKNFGDTHAVEGIDLTVPAGTFYGLVGPNGAGKTTTLSMIAGLLKPDRGSITVAGVDAKAHPLAAKRLMGVLPDRLQIFDRLTGRQLLFYYGVLRGLSPAVVERRTADLARAFDLTDALGRAVSDYSAGMVKKVMLAGALIHSPRLLVLDEPFEAVDPVSSAIILDILSTYVTHGGTVILSSHGMDLVERVCSRVAVLVAGQVLAEGTIDEVRGELTLEQRFIELAGGLSDVEGLEWLHTFSD